MSKKNRRPQKKKYQPVRNEALGAGMRELRQGSRTSPHKMRNRIDRGDWRRMKQSGKVEE